ncbi:MAG: hypothetical protein F4X97_06520 [Boseongicola sp. SB0662_bin_57]|nr:hypothetical protein [Boseongicola sp. SB0662_bin_57]
MNANLKLLPAALLVSVLALAGCGGGSGSDGDMDDMMPEMTEAQKCAAKGQGYTLDDEDMCVNVDDAVDKAYEDGKEKGAEEEGMKRDKAADDQKMSDDMKADQKAAKALFDILRGFDGLVGTDAEGPPVVNYALAATKPTDAALKKAPAYDAQHIVVTGKAFKDEYGKNTTYDEGRITVAEATNSTADAKVGGDAFSTIGAKEHETNAENDSVFSVAGTYHGVSGRYVCTPGSGATCLSTKSDTGLTLSGGVWTFMAGNANDKVNDGKAVEYGWWATHTAGNLSAVDFYRNAAGAYVDSSQATTYAFTGSGSASYTGTAVGQYAVHRGEGSESDSGQFTADAKLSADFAASSRTISGTIDNFHGSDGEMREGWSIDLVSKTVGTDGAFTNTSGEANSGKTVWNMGDSKAGASGEWVGNLYQKHGLSTAATSAPTAASGAFEARYNNVGSMIGVFGAELDE